MTTKITDKNISNLANIGVQWQSVFTGDGSTGLTAVAGRGYFIDTTSGTVTVTLPASPSAGDVVVLKDYAKTWNTNNVTLASALFDGVAAQTPSFSTNAQTVTLVYMDGTKGWSLINDDVVSGLGTVFIAATGGTVATSGDYKIHTFTGDGCFVVSQGPSGGTPGVDYLVLAGGGGGGAANGGGGGGGAGGYRESCGVGYTSSPLGACVSALTVSAATYPITVGSGGAGACSGSYANTNGSNSIFSTITSAGGGKGGSNPAPNGSPGGSGGAGSHPAGTGGSGNTPPTSPSQGNNGGTGSGNTGGGGGGAGAAGSNAPGCNAPVAGAGGAGIASSITGSPVTRGGGGGGNSESYTGGAGGPGGGGAGSSGAGNGTAGTANTGGGGGGNDSSPTGFTGGAGGKGIVILRYKFQ